MTWASHSLPAEIERAQPHELVHGAGHRRLPAERRNLERLALEGYHFCEGCLNVTELVVNHCSLCGSALVVWCAPVFGQEGQQ